MQEMAAAAHLRWAFKSVQTVEVFRRGERATLKEYVTFSLRLFFVACIWRARWRGAWMSVPLGYDISHSFSLNTPRLWQKYMWKGRWDSGRMPGDVNPHPGNGKTSLGSFLDGVWSLFRTQSLLNHLTSSVLHSLHHPHPSLSLSVSLPSLRTLSPPNTTSV